jgi:hypothetical protein
LSFPAFKIRSGKPQSPVAGFQLPLSHICYGT